MKKSWINSIKKDNRLHNLQAIALFFWLNNWSFASSILPSPKGANVNNRGWNDRREWNLRIVTDTLLSSPKGANRSKTGCGSPPLGTLSPYYWLSAGSMTFGHSTSGYWKLAPFGDRRLLAKLEYKICGFLTFPATFPRNLLQIWK